MAEIRKNMFSKELRQMMYGFGDAINPQTDTVDTVYDYLIDYLNILLTKTHSMAKIKGKTKTEDLMYFLKRDRIKYSRVKTLLLKNEEFKEERKIFDRKEFEAE